MASEDWVYSAEAGQQSERSFHDYKDALVFAKEVHRNVQASSNKTFTCIVFQNGIFIKEIVATQEDGTGVSFTRLVIDVCGEEKCYSSRDRDLVDGFWKANLRRFSMKELKSDLIDRFVELANNTANVDFVTSMLTNVVATYSYQFKNMYKGSNNIYLSENRENVYFKDRLMRVFSHAKAVPNVMSILNDPNKLLEALRIDIDGDQENEFYDPMANEMKNFEKTDSEEVEHLLFFLDMEGLEPLRDDQPWIFQNDHNEGEAVSINMRRLQNSNIDPI